MQYSFDANAIGVVLDAAVGRALGTAFALLRPDWMITAKHVVVLDGLPRTDLVILLLSGQYPVRVHALHPEVDLAVLELGPGAPCKTPLYPSYAGFAGSEGLVSIGYSPSRAPDPATPRVVTGYPITGYETVLRERALGTEELITFKAPVSEGGNSGSPVLGGGSGVVGVVTENFTSAEVTYARATSLAPLLRGLMLEPSWRSVR